MRVIKVKFEFIMPFFLNVLVAMNFCAFIALHSFPAPAPEPVAALPEENPPFMFTIEGLSPAFLLEREEPEDVVFDCYRDMASREWVVSFFTHVCGSRDIAEVVLTNAEHFNISPSLAFALCWEESQYKPTAVNRRNLNGSIDRGLFQLNDRSFPKLAEVDFFNPRINAWYGMEYLRWCLDSGGSEIAALAMYNAGSGRVSSTGAPKHTLDYIARIMASRQKIDTLFSVEIALAQEPSFALELELAPEDLDTGTELADASEIDDAKGSAERSRFALLSPLLGM